MDWKKKVDELNVRHLKMKQKLANQKLSTEAPYHHMDKSKKRHSSVIFKSTPCHGCSSDSAFGLDAFSKLPLAKASVNLGSGGCPTGIYNYFKIEFQYAQMLEYREELNTE